MTFKFENQPGDGGNCCADHVRGRPSKTASNHREVLFQRCGCYRVQFGWPGSEMFTDRGRTFRSVILVHPFKQIAFNHTTFFHFLAHGDD